MSMADYVPGGTFDPGAMSEGQCAEKCVCSALDRGLMSITSALLQIDEDLKQKQDKHCETVDKCKQEITDLIDQRFRGSTKTLEECRSDLANGLGGTLDYAVACAGAALDRARYYCPDGSEPPCIEQEKPIVYIGYCNQLTGNYFAAREGAPLIDPMALAVARAETEAVALYEAGEYCRKYTHPVTSISLPLGPPPSKLFTTFCDIGSFVNGTAAGELSSQKTGAFSAGAINEFISALGRYGVGSVNLENIGEVLTSIFTASTTSGPYLATQFIPVMAATLGCTDPAWASGLEIIAAIGMVEQASGVNFSAYTTSIDYVINAGCRRKFLPPDQASLAFLADALSYEATDAHFAIAGFCPDATRQRIAILETKPTPEQLISMVRRGLITLAEYASRMRQLGFLNGGVVNNIYQTSLHVPDSATVIKMGMQGVTDDSNVNKYQLDAESELLYDPRLHDWFAANGVTDLEIRDLWRAHWTNPGTNILTQFLRELRDDENIGSEQELEETFQEGLSSLGVSPYFRKHFRAVAFAPLNKRDIHQAYITGLIADDKIQKHLRKTGYADDLLPILIDELKPARRQHIQSHICIRQWIEQQIDSGTTRECLKADGYQDDTINQAFTDAEYRFETSSWGQAYIQGRIDVSTFQQQLIAWGVTDAGASAIAAKLSYRITDHRSIHSYTVGTIDRVTAIIQMQTDGITTAVAERLLHFADDTIRDNDAVACTQGVKSRYLIGDITRSQAHNMLTGFGIVEHRTEQLLRSFDCAKHAEGKHVAVEKLCHWMYIGVLSPADFYDRLLRLGYSDTDASLLLQDCLQANTMRQLKEAERVAKELQSKIDKASRAAKMAQATKDRNAERLRKARSDKATIRANRDKQLLVSAERIANGASVTLVDAMNVARNGLDVAQQSYGLNVDEALKIVVIASENMKKRDIADFIPQVQQLSQGAVDAALAPSDSEVGIPPNTNGSTQPSV